jgi:hypothetical protein
MDSICQTIAIMERDAILAVRIPAEIKDAVRRAGDDDHGRSLSGMVVRILEEWVTERGYLKAKSGGKRKGK